MASAGTGGLRHNARSCGYWRPKASSSSSSPVHHKGLSQLYLSVCLLVHSILLWQWFEFNLFSSFPDFPNFSDSCVATPLLWTFVCLPLHAWHDPLMSTRS